MRWNKKFFNQLRWIKSNNHFLHAIQWTDKFDLIFFREQREERIVVYKIQLDIKCIRSVRLWLRDCQWKNWLQQNNKSESDSFLIVSAKINNWSQVTAAVFRSDCSLLQTAAEYWVSSLDGCNQHYKGLATKAACQCHKTISLTRLSPTLSVLNHDGRLSVVRRNGTPGSTVSPLASTTNVMTSLVYLRGTPGLELINN